MIQTIRVNFQAVETEFRVSRNLHDFAIITSDLRDGRRPRKYFVWEIKDLNYLREQRFVDRRYLSINCDLQKGTYPTISNIEIAYLPHVLRGDQRNLNPEFENNPYLHVNPWELSKRTPESLTVDNADSPLD